MEEKFSLGISCTVCGDNSNLKRCGICKCTYYCSREHQIKDWASHKAVCQSLKSNQEGSIKDTHSDGMVAKQEQQHVLFTEDQDKGNINADQRANKCNSIKNENMHNNEDDIELNNNKGEKEFDDVIQFDARPLKYEEFISMSPHESEQEVAKIVVDNLNEKGFCVVDGLFTRKNIKKALRDIEKCASDNRFNSGKLGGGRTSGEQDQQVINASIRRDKIMWLEGTEEDLKGITTIVSRMDSILWEFNKFLDKKYFINGRTKAMVACYPGNGSYYRRHVDNPHGDGRVVTCILYLNEDWIVQEDGGLLRILPAETDGYVDIAPVANRLLFFWCDKRNPHEVHPAFKTRYAITVWYMDEDERKRAKRECLLGEMDKVRGESVLQERQQRRKEMEKINQEIEDAATDAIASLSMEELKAMSDLIAGQPDAEEILASMGVSPNIRTKLLHKLQNLETDSGLK